MRIDRPAVSIILGTDRADDLIESYNSLVRLALVYRGEGDYWVAEVPSLPGCVSQGTSVEDALTNVREAIELYVDTLIAENRAVPEDHFDALVIAV